MGFLFLGVLIVFLLLVSPILAYRAYLRVRELERRSAPSELKNVGARLAALEQKVGELNRRLVEAGAAAAAARLPVPAEAVPPTPPSPRPPAAPPATQPPVRPLRQSTEPPAPPAGGLDLETLIAGRWLNRIGIAAVLLAVAFFLKYAFDNNWVGPSGRVTIGLLAGAGLLVYSQWLLGRGYRYFADGMTGLGGGVLYLSLYAAWDYYHLVPQGVAFAGMIVVTGALIAIAVGRDSQSIAFLALIGGFLTPMLLSTGRDAQLELFTYLAVLNAGLLALARARNWRALEPVALLWTIIYYTGWYDAFYDPSKLVRTSFFATLFFVGFAALPVVRSRREDKLRGAQVFLVLLNATWFLLALHAMLYHQHRWALTVAVLLLAAAHLGVTRLLPPTKLKEPSATRLLFTGLALTFVTLAIPIRLEGKWITMAWAVEGAIFIWSGLRAQLRLLRGAGLLLFGVVALRLLLIPIPAERFLLNPRFAIFAVTVACFAAALFFVRRNEVSLSDDERNLFAAVGVAVNVFALWALSMEVWDVFGRMQTASSAGIDPGLAQQLALSLLWTLYATALIAVGMRNSLPPLRWQGLALFGLVVGKVFLLDLSFLERGYRIISFMALGVVLLVVSFLYQKRLAASRTQDKL